ncbi:MAG TPA: tetratricopeptide repeat protein [Bryobacteraceae bacterium]|nr:tetratricopeptide repeat protein [Bryobacteraceae bacterium]
MRCALLLFAAVAAWGETALYEVRGRLIPATQASVWLHGATAPFEDSTLAGDDGQFHFRGLAAGAYTLGVFVPGRGEMRRTVEVGASQADAKKRIGLTVELRDGKFESQDSLRREAMVSVKELAIPERARREYEEAVQRLSRRDVDGAVAHFKRAVELAPQFPEAWNHLGTIAYQARDYPRAESSFRRALEADPKSFQPLVNLGGVCINLGKLEEALQYNLYAALTRPNDALANSQLGMSYFYSGKLDLAQKYLTAAKRLDPAHFSHPQLLLAEIALRRQEPAAATTELQEFLQYHPDAPEAGRIKEKLAQLHAASDPAQAFGVTGMARTFSTTPEIATLDGDAYSVYRQDGRYSLRSRDAGGQVRQSSIDATIGSGRHLRMLLSRTANGWMELPLAWYSENGGHYAAGPGFGFSSACLGCHARQKDDHVAGFGCASCHGQAGSGKPTQAVCLECHPAGGADSVHGSVATAKLAADEKFELNSAGYRLLASRCYLAAAGRLTCTTCHPAHSFSKTVAEYRMVCRGCHASTHEAQPLDCVRCHMPKRQAQDTPRLMVTDHRIQRPL